MTPPPVTAPAAREGTVFISYARADDAKPPHDEMALGWVTFFWDQLRWALTTEGAKRAKLWLDRYEIDPADAFTPVIEKAVSEAKVIVAVFSNNWLQSDWCQKEVDGFAKTHGDASERIVSVFKHETKRNLLPPLLQGVNAKEGYAFFEVDPRGEVREFYWRKLEDEKNYYKLLKRIAKAIIERLDAEDLEPPPGAAASSPTSTASGRTVFLAQCTKDLRDARQRLCNDLAGAGIAVVPAIDDLPEKAADYAAAIQAASAGADMAVFPLGDGHGAMPEGGSEPIVDLQLRLVRQAERTLPRILWAPRWLPDKRDTERDPFAVAKSFGGPLAGEEVFGKEVTDLSQWIRQRLEQKPEDVARSRSPGLIVVAGAVAEDDELVSGLFGVLQGLGPEFAAVFAGDPLPDDVHATFLLPWGAADRPAIDRFLASLPPGQRVICLRLPGGDEAAKRRFAVAGVTAPRLAALPADLRSAHELLIGLELLDAEGGQR